MILIKTYDEQGPIGKIEMAQQSNGLFEALKKSGLSMTVEGMLPEFTASDNNRRFGLMPIGWCEQDGDAWASIEESEVPVWIRRSEEETREFLAI